MPTKEIRLRLESHAPPYVAPPHVDWPFSANRSRRSTIQPHLSLCNKNEVHFRRFFSDNFS